MHAQLMALLSAVGFDAGDLLPLRRSGLNGAQLLLLDDADIACLTGLPKHKTHRLRRLQVGGHACTHAACWPLHAPGTG